MDRLLWFGVGIIVLLVTVALYYHILLYRKNKQLKAAQVELENTLAQRKVRNINSIVIIARAVLDAQVSLTEASIRINTISQAMQLDGETLEALSVFRQLAEATAHIPMLDKWRALSKEERVAFDREREKIESDFRDFALVAAKKIVKEALLTR